MELRNTDIIQNSIIQTSFEYIDNILQDYQKLQPEFKYHLNYGTNLNQEFVEDTDYFNIVMFTGSVDKIPSYYNEINGVNQLLYAGYFDIALSIINVFLASIVNKKTELSTLISIVCSVSLALHINIVFNTAPLVKSSTVCSVSVIVPA